MLVDLQALPVPEFVVRDPAARVQELVARYEAETGKTLYPGQPERLLIDLIAYADQNLRAAIQYAGEQNLLATAQGAALDNLAAFFGVTRLPGETDDALRERVRLAPEAFTVAGSTGSYRFHALSADPSIVDVAVISPSPGVVNLYPLVTTGLPSQAILDAVTAAVSADDVRPLTDQVQVLAPTPVDYTITATVTPYVGQNPDLTLQAAQAAAADLVAQWNARLGHDIVRSQIIGRLQAVPGVYRVDLTAPATDQVLQPHEWARNTGINLTPGAAEDG